MQKGCYHGIENSQKGGRMELLDIQKATARLTRVTALTGLPGAGKSTTLKALAAIARPSMLLERAPEDLGSFSDEQIAWSALQFQEITNIALPALPELPELFHTLPERIRWLMAALAAMKRLESGVLLLEHPEHYLHPAHSTRFLEAMAEWIQKRLTLVVFSTCSDPFLFSTYQVLSRMGLGQEISVWFLMYDPRSQSTYYEHFDHQEVRVFYDLGLSIVRFWTRPGIPRPRGIQKAQ